MSTSLYVLFMWSILPLFSFSLQLLCNLIDTDKRFPRKTPPLEALIYLPHDFENFIETPDFLDTYTKIF